MVLAFRSPYGRAVIAVCLLCGIGCFAVWGFCRSAESVALQLGQRRLKTKGHAFQLKQFQVNKGNITLAKEYYKDTVSPHLQFLTPATIETSKLRDLLDYFGFPKLTATDLHRLSSDALMKIDGGILATRFFAPKITDVVEKPAMVPAGGFGWRNLVRLQAKPGSSAEKNGMEALFFLQNVFENSVMGDPFDPNKNVSKNNQAIVVRKTGPFEEAKQPIYFLTYGPLVEIDKQGPVKEGGEFKEDGKLSFSLNATFDENDRDPETNLPPNEYFVPDSCIQCHGAVRRRGKLNFLDTDHWFDRVVPAYGLNDPRYQEEDFASLAASPHGLLYDGGKDTTMPQFKTAFEVIRTLNKEIAAQNERVVGGQNFQLAAAKKWLDLHALGGQFDSKHAPPFERGFGDTPWDRTQETHKKLLYFFNRYCYRCHSSVKFNVFDRTRVAQLADDMQERVTEISDSSRWMPQDRIFPGLNVKTGEATGDLKEFLDLLKTLNQ